MRELDIEELDVVAGGHQCTPADGTYSIPSTKMYSGLDHVYVSLVAATSHIIERVANAF